MYSDPEKLLRAMFDVAVAAAQPSLCVPPHLPEKPEGKLIVIGAGKASAAMARAVEQHWSGPLSGLVVTRYGHAVACDTIEVVEAAHPVPDKAGLDAAARILELARSAGPDDTVLCLISGGGSALLPMPLEPLTLEDKQAVTRALLACGAPISEINCVRRHLSGIKGGRLAAAAHPARVVSLLISDVPGDHPLDIASGPTVGDPTTADDARAILERYNISAPQAVLDVLASARCESVKPDDERLKNATNVMIAAPQISLEAAAEIAVRDGLPVHILSDAIEGEARDVGKTLAGIALQVARRGQPFEPPCILLSGGETTVTVRGQGRGGRNVEFLLSLAQTLEAQPGIWALAADTDGVDGIEETAGAIVTPDTRERGLAKGMTLAAALADNDGHGFFGALGDAVVTGPTTTNVNDFRAIYIRERAEERT
ncbi:glycerate kinase [uncultured Martelella sp.]|uniref:glycerate kinase type-2 family protein n=1 Tax=uncultured Martelella sp. TaxID=392331 RepID=UPI0029C7C04B|nr:glycerate kinase [uncultured Martelella sp.]